jgi:predicted DNA-binding transcriptional regulator AlpA
VWGITVPIHGSASGRFLSVSEVSKRLNKSLSTITRLCKSGQFEGAIGGSRGVPWLIPESAVIKFEAGPRELHNNCASCGKKVPKRHRGQHTCKKKP